MRSQSEEAIWIYSQSTGQLTHDAQHVGYGYSGWGPGKDDPQMQQVAEIGPIPQGFYSIELIRDEQGLPCEYEGKLEPVMRLIPEPTNNMFGRDGFLIHGDSVDNPGTASRGCVILKHDVRQQVAASDDTDLQVVS